MFGETKHIRNFFKVEFIRKLSGVTVGQVFLFIRPIAKKQCQSRHGINQYSDASQNLASFYNIKPKLSEPTALFLLIPNM